MIEATGSADAGNPAEATAPAGISSVVVVVLFWPIEADAQKKIIIVKKSGQIRSYKRRVRLHVIAHKLA